jgi:hypothetical protein
MCSSLSVWVSPGTPVSSTNQTDRHDITEILLKLALNCEENLPIFLVKKWIFVSWFCGKA